MSRAGAPVVNDLPDLSGAVQGGRPPAGVPARAESDSVLRGKYIRPDGPVVHRALRAR